jgi:hypothetical protein
MNRPHINLLIHRLVDAARKATISQHENRDDTNVKNQVFLNAQLAVNEALDAVESEIEDLKFDIENAHE